MAHAIVESPRIETPTTPFQTMQFPSPSPSVNGSIAVRKGANGASLRPGVYRASYGPNSVYNRKISSPTITSVQVVAEQYTSVKEHICRELGTGIGARWMDTSYTGLLEFIRHERLTKLPPKGSSADRVLIAAQHFAEYVQRLTLVVEPYTAQSGAACNLVFGQCLLMLELGDKNSAALELAFNLFYQLGLGLHPLIPVLRDLEITGPEIFDQVGWAFSELLSIVSNVAVTFHTAVKSTDGSVRFDIYRAFGHSIHSYRSRIKRCALDIWERVLSHSSLHDEHQIEELQKWLSPQDSIMAFLASDHVNLSSRPEEFTCTWFQPHLNSFFKETRRMLVVEGRAGTGKTTLANWVVDRLRRPVAKKNASVISFFFDKNVKVLESSLSMIKTLLLQLISQRIGDVDLFNVIFDSYQDSRNLIGRQEQETRMWRAFRDALAAVEPSENEPIVVVVDGLDEMNDGENMDAKAEARKASDRLHQLAREIPGVRVIEFTKHIAPAAHADTIHLDLTADMLYDDIQTIARQGLSAHKHFSDRDTMAQEHVTDRIVTAANGIALVAALVVQFARLQTTHAAFDEAIERLTAKQSETAIDDCVRALLHALNLDSDSKLVLTWLVTAERPLTLSEIEQLLQVRPEQSRIVDRKIPLTRILSDIAPFIVAGEGLVTLRHNLVKQALINIPKKSPVCLNLENRNIDMLVRLLICSRRHIQDEQEPRLLILDQPAIETKVGSHRILEYTARYWTHLIKETPTVYNKKTKELGKLPTELAAVFPSSISFVLVESGYWGNQSFPHEAIELFKIAYEVRKALSGPEHPSVLQSAIVCALMCESFKFNVMAIEWYGVVIQIAKTTLGVQSDIVVTCCTTLLRISESHITKTRTVITTQREQSLLVLISSYTHRYGAESKEVLELYTKLEELYIFISEETKVTEIREKIRKIVVIMRGSKHSHGHEDDDDVDRHLDVVLTSGGHGKDVTGLGKLLFGYVDTEEASWTLKQVQILIKLAVTLIERKEFIKAEETLIELWLKLTEICVCTQICDWHELKITVMLHYVSMLHSLNRTEEAFAVLLCCWNEYSVHSVSSFEAIIVLFKQIGVWMKVVGKYTFALTVFQKCWQWYKSAHREESSEYKSIEEHITVTSKEIVVTSSATTVSSSSESVIRQVFESSFESSSATTTTTSVNSTSIELCASLVSIYMAKEEYHEAVSVIKSTLKHSWSSFFLESMESVTLTETHLAESVKLVTTLAECYVKQKRLEKAEWVYRRLFSVYRKSYDLKHELVVQYCNLYLGFLRTHNMFVQIITFYQELLSEYRIFYGLTHTMTIRILYSLGDICRTHHLTHGYWIEYYLEIVSNLNKGKLVCHHDAFRALIIVAEHHYETLRFAEAVVYFRSIIATFLAQGTAIAYFKDVDIVQTMLEKYYRVIRETKVELSLYISTLKEIRTACIKFYGEESSVSVSVTEVLAETCSQSEKYEMEALAYYEHILKHSTSVSTTTVTRSKAMVKSLYVKQVTHASSSTTVTKEMMERATTMSYDRYIEVRKSSSSITSETTMAQFKELISLYQKQELVEKSVTELQSYLVECVLSVTSSKELVDAARFLSGIYLSCKSVAKALALVRELKMQLIYKTKSKDCGFSVIQAGRVSFSFIATLEYHLRADYTLTVAGFMAELMAEAIFYDRFVTSIKTKGAHIQTVFMHAARIRRILARQSRLGDFVIIENQAITYFTEKLVTVVEQSSKAAVRAFVILILTHFSQHGTTQNFVVSCGRAAVTQLNALLKAQKFQEAYELTKCTFSYLRTSGGLDDPTEIQLGFLLAILMAGRGEHKIKAADATLRQTMMALSRKILEEVFNICDKFQIDLVGLEETELKELIALVGDQGDMKRMWKLLEALWTSREGQSKWPREFVLSLGKCLVQVRFENEKRSEAISLAENLAYNVRRVNGARNKDSLAMYGLLASLYTSTADFCLKESAAKKTNPVEKKRNSEMARVCYKKAINLHEEVLKQLVENQSDADDDDDDAYSDISSMIGGGAGMNGHDQSNHHGHLHLVAHGSRPATQESVTQSSSGFQGTREDLVAAVRKHVQMLKLAAQRFGGFSKPVIEYDRLTSKVWSDFKNELRMGEDQVLSRKWSFEGFGGGKAEADLSVDGFTRPQEWVMT